MAKALTLQEAVQVHRMRSAAVKLRELARDLQEHEPLLTARAVPEYLPGLMLDAAVVLEGGEPYAK